jgi:hypothetical protein
MTAVQTPHIMCITGAGAQRHTAKVPSTKGIPPAARQTIEQYLKLVDWASLLANASPQENDQSWISSTEFLTWQETQLTPSQDIGRQIQNLIHEPSETVLLEELDDIKHTMGQDTPLSWLIETLTEELWNGEQFQGGDLPIQCMTGLQTVWHHLTAHIKQDRKASGNTIRSWRISLTSDYTTNKQGCPICQIRHTATCSTCYRPKCGKEFCEASKDPCPTCQEINTPTPDTKEIDIPSANLHVMGLDFVERISGVRMIPRSAEMEDENTDSQTDPDIQFQVRIKGWSDLKQQNRAKTLLTLSDKKMVKSLQHHRDILFIPRSWWPYLHNTLEQDEPGWWYTVSNEMGYQGCRSCKNRIGKDHQDADRCPECPAKVRKRKNSGSTKNQDKNQKGRPEQASNRPQRSVSRPNYAEPPDAPMDEDSEEASDNDSGDMQIGYLCISADPRPAQTGFPLERETDEVTNSTDAQMGRHTARYLHPAISTYIADWEADLASTSTG